MPAPLFSYGGARQQYSYCMFCNAANYNHPRLSIIIAMARFIFFFDNAKIGKY